MVDGQMLSWIRVDNCRAITLNGQAQSGQALQALKTTSAVSPSPAIQKPDPMCLRNALCNSSRMKCCSSPVALHN